jgi:type I restriction enzyme, S subunit
MFYVQILSQLQNRIDAEYYSPEALEAEKKLDAFGEFKPLGQLIQSGYRVVYHGIDSIDSLDEDNKIKFLSPTDIDDSGEIRFENSKEVPYYYSTQYPKGLAKAGELLIEVKGNVSKLAVVPENFPDRLIISGSLYKAKLKEGTDPWFVMSFLKSNAGQALKKRLTSNTIISFIAKDELYSIRIPDPKEKKVQSYIGDKVRQAERLRDRSRELDINAKDKVSEYFDCFKASPRRKIYSTEAQCITGRIDSWSYNPRFLEAVAAIKNSGSTLIDLEKITKKITNGATPKGATFSNQGIPWIRGKDFSNGDIIAESLPMMDIYSESTMKRSRLEYGDLLLSIKGTVGDVAVVDESLVGFNINQDVARIQLGSIEEAHFLALFLESSLGQVLIEQQVYGAINPFFSLENLRAFLVPDPNSIDRVYKSLVVGLRSKSVIYRRFSNWLTVAAKLLVEALIEGKLSEAELKAAQEGLEKGDTTLDREILDRLTRKGIDFPNEAPLFPDLDALYNALTSLNETETIEAANPGNSRAAKVYHLHKTPLALASEAPETSYTKPKEVPE